MAGQLPPARLTTRTGKTVTTPAAYPSPARQTVSKKDPFFSCTFSRPFKDQSGAWRNGTSFGLNDLEDLVTVACDAKEWIAVHTLKR